jgi:HAD superfamily hydrolase (TIGR01509 family)
MNLQQDKPTLESTLKSVDTEEFIDIHFYRPIGYWWALLFRRLGITPNQVTIASIFIGIAAGICFFFNSFWINLLGVFLLIWANSYDSADGQLARMTGQKTELGRILDGVCGDLWFISIYFAVIFRLLPVWGFWIFLLAFVAGYYHSKQALMADYYRNVYLLFLKGKKGSEWDHSSDLCKRYATIDWKKKPLVKLFEKVYIIYTKEQERLTPYLQEMRKIINDQYQGKAPERFRESFLKKTFPLLKYTNMLSFNLRAIVLFICILAGFPWIYFIFEITVLNIMLIYMVLRHEKICREFTTVSLQAQRGNNPVSGVKGIIFDYGATIDTNGKHWAEALWDAYVATGIPVSKPQFKDAYVYVERYLAMHPVILPDDNFKNVLLKKAGLQLNRLKDESFLPADYNSSEYSLAISNQCYNFVLAVLKDVKPVLEELSSRYPLALVSNFYGNVETVLKDFGLRDYFGEIVESSVVGIRKPDPAIFALGVKALGLKPEEVVVIGDSYKKDIYPAGQVGCRTIWLKGVGWDGGESGTADVVIADFSELKALFSCGNGRIKR